MEKGILYQTIDLLEFSKKFSSEEQCWQHLFNLRWPEHFICPVCGCTEYSYHSTRKLCQCKACKHQTSVTAGTIFHKTRTPLVKWFWAIFLMTRQKGGISARALRKLLDIKSYQTIWTMCHKIRKAMQDRDANYQLGGLIEMDESYFGGKKSGKRGRGAEGKSIVSVCVENKDGKSGYATMKVISKATSEELLSVADEKIKQDSTIRTDKFSSYKQFEKSNFKHEPVKGSGKDAPKNLPWVHTLIGNVKATIRGIFHGVSGKHLQRFLSEFCYRFNRRFKEGELLDRLLTACLRTTTITFAELNG